MPHYTHIETKDRRERLSICCMLFGAAAKGEGGMFPLLFRHAILIGCHSGIKERYQGKKKNSNSDSTSLLSPGLLILSWILGGGFQELIHPPLPIQNFFFSVDGRFRAASLEKVDFHFFVPFLWGSFFCLLSSSSSCLDFLSSKAGTPV